LVLISFNQPTKKLAKGGVLRKRNIAACETRNAGIGKQYLTNYNTANAYADGSLALDEGLDMLRLAHVAPGVKKNPSGNLSFTKRTLVGWMSES
jgi:hypothetical protein